MSDVRTDAARARAELPMTGRAFASVREKLVGRLLATPIGARDEREGLYFAINALDGVQGELFAAASADQVEDYVEGLQGEG
jgi:hypothetical protein